MPNKKRTFFKVLLYGGREETRTPMPKALDPKSSASTNFATRPYSLYQPFLAYSIQLSIFPWLRRLPSPLEKRYSIFFLRQSATHTENNSNLTYKKQKSRYYLFFFHKRKDLSCSFAINGVQKENSSFPFFSLCSLTPNSNYKTMFCESSRNLKIK